MLHLFELVFAHRVLHSPADLGCQESGRLVHYRFLRSQESVFLLLLWKYRVTHDLSGVTLSPRRHRKAPGPDGAGGHLHTSLSSCSRPGSWPPRSVCRDWWHRNWNFDRRLEPRIIYCSRSWEPKAFCIDFCTSLAVVLWNPSVESLFDKLTASCPRKTRKTVPNVFLFLDGTVHCCSSDVWASPV